MLARVRWIRTSIEQVEKLSKIVGQALSHMNRLNQPRSLSKPMGNKIFIGHGHSPVWRELKDFIQDRLRQPWEEFDRIATAGITTVDRLSEMLDDSSFAFLVLTAEDETADGKTQARMNVIHEAGLFQGRLGFDRAIVLLEDECKEFSNIHGLGQIRFKEDKISAIFEEIRKLLEERGVISG